MKEQLKAATSYFARTAIIWLVSLLLISIFEIVFNGLTHEFPPSLSATLLWSWLAVLFFWIKTLLMVYLIYLLVFAVVPKASSIVLRIMFLLLTVLHLGLILYFNSSLVPLGSDVYGYSIADMVQTVGASGGVSITSVIGLLLICTLLYAAFKYLPNKFKVPSLLTFLLVPLSLLFMLTGMADFVMGLHRFKSDFANNLVLHKTDYFLASSYSHFFINDDQDVDIYADSYIGDYGDQKTDVPQFNYVNESAYPFLHDETQSDVLSPFFNIGVTPPNIVIVLVEGLGRAFTNEGAYLGNFTPFIDSLSGQSLYWKNFLSQGGRTFAVLPSLMASLPFAKNGFLELGRQMPEHISLYSILKHNGYSSSFYYGGNSGFDNMKLFLQRNQVDKIYDEATFPSGYTKLPSVNGFTWGYNDKELFRHYLNTKSSFSQQPELSVVLTVSTHSPFFINEQEKYADRFEKRMTALAFEEDKKIAYRKYKLQYSSILYTDDALQGFFDAYKKRSDYGNTIFLITGDHRMPEIPMSSKIDRFHVPLIIYSPMLKRTAQFESVSTHFDIAPSLLAFLKQNYKINVPNAASWVGGGLDTARQFRNVHAYPLIQTKTETIDFVMGEYHLNGNTLFKLSADMVAEQVVDQQKYEQLKNAFDNFKRKNSTVTGGKKLIPDSIFRNYSGSLSSSVDKNSKRN